MRIVYRRFTDSLVNQVTDSTINNNGILCNNLYSSIIELLFLRDNLLMNVMQMIINWYVIVSLVTVAADLCRYKVET